MFELVRCLRVGLHTLLVGPRGIGKTRLMKEAIAVLTGVTRPIALAQTVAPRLRRPLMPRRIIPPESVIFVAHVAPLGDCLKEICERLHAARLLAVPASDAALSWTALRRKLGSLGTPRLQALVIESLSARPFVIFLDSLDRIAPSHQFLLDSLFRVAVVCGGVVQMKESFHFRRVWSSFHRIDLAPLPERSSRQLIQHMLSIHAIQVSDQESYIRQLMKSAGGNPFHIRNLIWQASQRRSEDELGILRRREEGEYFNMGPIYILVASLLTLSKIFAIGTDNREFYIYFSALGFLVYLVFRVFRNFFLFRPQKYGR